MSYHQDAEGTKQTHNEGMTCSFQDLDVFQGLNVWVAVNGGYDFQKNLLKVWDYVTSTACHVQYCLVFQLSIFGVVNLMV